MDRQAGREVIHSLQVGRGVAAVAVVAVVAHHERRGAAGACAAHGR